MKSITTIIVLAYLFSQTVYGAENIGGENKGITIVPKYFEPSSGASNGGLGFSYKIDKTIATSSDQQGLSKAFNLEFKAEGNVAFNSDINPTDFLKTGLDLNYVYNYASAVTIGSPGSGCDPADPATVKKCEEEAQHSKTGDAYAIFAGLIGSIESDQKFDKRNIAFGAHITSVYRPAPGAFVNQANFFDWPFRLTRVLTSHPMGFDASPDAFPKLILALERIKPMNDKDRTAILGTTQDYNRANMEIAMTSPVGMMQGKQVKFEWSWRYFKEVGANGAIKAAGLDHFRYSAATLKHDSGWQLTYASGKLPLDRQNDKMWELGYKIKFD